jgi:hypothetical protein
MRVECGDCKECNERIGCSRVVAMTTREAVDGRSQRAVSVSARLRAETYDAVRKMADVERRTVSNLVAKMVEQQVKMELGGAARAVSELSRRLGSQRPGDI